MRRKLFLLESMKLRKGDTFEFGIWKNKPIEWKVLDVGNGILCISKYCLDKRMFDEESNVWKNSELRQWLNLDFYSRAFNSDEKSFILPYKGDKVNLLSALEALRHLPSNSERKATDRNGNKAWWWLRLPGYGNDSAPYVDYIGGFYYYDIGNASGSVRPVILLKKDVENFLEPEL